MKKSKTEIKTSRALNKLKSQVKRLKMTIILITITYIVSLTILILSINYFLPDNKKQAKILFSNLVIDKTINESHLKKYFK